MWIFRTSCQVWNRLTWMRVLETPARVFRFDPSVSHCHSREVGRVFHSNRMSSTTSVLGTECYSLENLMGGGSGGGGFTDGSSLIDILSLHCHVSGQGEQGKCWLIPFGIPSSSGTQLLWQLYVCRLFMLRRVFFNFLVGIFVCESTFDLCATERTRPEARTRTSGKAWTFWWSWARLKRSCGNSKFRFEGLEMCIQGIRLGKLIAEVRCAIHSMVPWV